MRPPLAERVLQMLIEVIELADLNGKLACVRATVKWLETVTSLGSSYVSTLMDKVFMLASRSLECFSFLNESDDQSVILFHMLNGPNDFVKTCCNLITRVLLVISCINNNWNEISAQCFMELFLTSKSCLLNLPNRKLPHKRDLVMALMDFFCQDLVHNSELKNIQLELFKTLVLDKTILKAILHEDASDFDYEHHETFRRQDLPEKNGFLLGISLQVVVLLLVFSKKKGFELPLNFLPKLLKKVAALGNLHWINDASMRDRNVWGSSIVLLIEMILSSVSTPGDVSEKVVKGIFELVKTAICLTWSPADDRNCARCSTYESSMSCFQPLGIATVLQIMNWGWVDDNAAQPPCAPLCKIQLASHVAQHITWDVCSSVDVTNFTEFVVGLVKKVDPLSVTLLSGVFTELCGRLLPEGPSRWAPLHRLLLDRLSIHGSENSCAYQETCLEVVGGIGRQLANGIKSLDPLTTSTSNEWDSSFGRMSSKKSSHKSCRDVELSILRVSCDNDETNPEFHYSNLMKDTLASICRLGFSNSHSHSLIGEAAVQISKLSSSLASTNLSILREAKRQIAQVLIEHLDPSVGQAFETLARIFQLEKLTVVRELTLPLFILLVVKGTQESHLRIKQLVEQSPGLTSTDNYITKVAQLCILPDVIVHIYTSLSEDQRTKALKFLESHLDISIEQVAQMNDVSRLLHQFVLNLYPHRTEARAGLAWLVSKAMNPLVKPLHGLLLQQHHSAHFRTEAALPDVSFESFGEYLQQHLCGILAFFDSRLLDDECPLEERRQYLLSLAIFMDLVGSQPVSRMRAKFIATLKLCLRYKVVEPKNVVQLWAIFLKTLERDSLIELLPDIVANLVSLYPIAPDYVKKALSSVFIKRRGQLEESIKQLFFLPDLPGLKDFQPILKAICPWRDLCVPSEGYLDPLELQLPPPNDFVDLLAAWVGGLQHSSRSVRRYCLASLVPSSIGGRRHNGGLMELSRLVVRALRAHRPSAIASTTHEVAADGTSSSSIRNLLSKLITSLITGLTRDSDQDIRLLYAKWLGALGAIDPSRLTLTLRTIESSPTGSIQTAFNWGHSFTFDVIMELAKIYMRGASPKQMDSAALAIQELLRLFAVSGASSNTDTEVPQIKRLLLGPELWAKFSQSVQDLLTPLLSSKYVVEGFTDWASIQSPIFGQDSCQSYETWIRLWSGSLKTYVSNSMAHSLFQFCEPVIKSDVEFARYILDPIALQVVIDGSQMGTVKLRSEVLAVLETVADTKQAGRYADRFPADFLFYGDSKPTSISPPMTRKLWKPWYPLAVETVFSLLDYLSAWLRARSADYAVVVAAIAKTTDRRPNDTFKPNVEERALLTELHLAVTRMSEFFDSLPHSVQARASRRIGGLARTLRNWEFSFADDEVAHKAFYVSGFIDRLEAPAGPLISDMGKESLIGLLETLTALHDTDGLTGVLAQMQHTGIHPSSKSIATLTKHDSIRSSLVRALQLENEDQLEMACANYEHVLSTAQSNAQAWGLHVGLFRCQLPDPTCLQALIARTDALLASHPCGNADNMAWARQLNELRVEAAIRLGDWDKLDQVMALESSELSWPVGLAKVLLSMKQGQDEVRRNRYLDNFMDELRLSQMTVLATSSLEGGSGYLRACEPLVNLSLLTEVESIIDLSNRLTKEVTAVSELGLPRCQKNSDLLVSNLLLWLDARVQQSKPTFHTLEPVLAMRHAALQLITSRLKATPPSSNSSLGDQLRAHQTRLLDSALGDSWLQRAKLARRAGQCMAAYTCVLNAECQGSAGALTERAKLLWQSGKREAALASLTEGLKALAYASVTSPFSPRNLAQSLAMPSPHSKPRVDRVLDTKFLLQALLLHAHYCEETSRFDFDTTRHLYSDICEAFPGCEKAHFRLAHYVDEARSQSGNQHDVLFKVALENYGQALACGSQFIFQSMPRFLSLWLDYGAEVAKMQQRQQQTSAASIGRRGTNQKSIESNMLNTFNEVQNLMRQSLSKIPAFQFYTAIGQILSRVCHEHPAVITMLIDLIVRIVLAHPQQTIWSVVSLHEASVSQRHERFQQICAAIRTQQKPLYKFISDFVGLCGHLRTISDLFLSSDRRDVKSFKISQVIRPFTRLLETCDLSNVLIPVHRQLVPSLLRPHASKEEIENHQPFGATSRFVCLVRLYDDVEILGSQTRPKKMRWLGSDGRRYIIVAKPNDDMRKDSRLMDMNSIINRFLMRNPQTCHRSLGIRTYGVIPLKEHGGLIEWVSNTQPFRNILTSLYAEIGRPFNWVTMNRYAPLLEDSLEVKREKFLKKLLPMYPLVFYRWFINVFPNPSEWYEARETYVRTCAVMSMVGYALGLGDRHTENILFDCTTGGLVHVDFSCVFNTGLTLPWPERVPFRLTRSLVHAMGPTGFEGTFRRCAEVTMHLLRREIDPLMAVFRPIYFDALVEKSSEPNAPAEAGHRGRKGGHELPSENKLTRSAIEKLKGMEDRLRGKITEHDDFSKLLPMSVEGQVDVLIKEATSVDRLCQMYKGWMPFL
uniref:non-specific serine/threonine protein kinase n=1 Tax=Echinococcus granulosus TaxID=6210 RepID=A0A068WNQ4_ECHGR|nr:phosphatidylinositol 3 and 4 kinase [Echinococcus granulosus]